MSLNYVILITSTGRQELALRHRRHQWAEELRHLHRQALVTKVAIVVAAFKRPLPCLATAVTSIGRIIAAMPSCPIVVARLASAQDAARTPCDARRLRSPPTSTASRLADFSLPPSIPLSAYRHSSSLISTSLS